MFIKLLKTIKSNSENTELAIAIIDDCEFDNDQVDKNIVDYIKALNRK